MNFMLKRKMHFEHIRTRKFLIMSVWSKKPMTSGLAPDDPAMICSTKWWRACTTLRSYKMNNLFIFGVENHQGLQKKIVVEQRFSLWSHSEFIRTYHVIM